MNPTNKYNIILGIESSCDDTSAAVIKNNTILSNIIAGQKIHQEYGGVVPELASRAHQQHIIPVVDNALKKAGVSLNELDAIAFTNGPGLLGSLLVGTSFAKALALSLEIPIIDVNHMYGHVLAHFIKYPEDEKETPNFPFICLTVSGGHTQIVLVKDFLEMEVLGETIDDAAGEAFDKAAKQLGFPYPGGPLVDKNAKNGNSEKYSFTYPRVDGYGYSFSGLKTQFINFLNKETQKNQNFVEENLSDICASYQQHIINYLFLKLEQVASDYGVKDIAIAGGVSANSCLRNHLTERGKLLGWRTFIPPFEFCTDNAAMIAMTGYYQFLNGKFADQSIAPTARLKI